MPLPLKLVDPMLCACTMIDVDDTTFSGRVPSEDLSGVDSAGAVAVMYASSNGTGISGTSDQLWSQLGEVEGSAEPRDAFGSALVGSPYQG